MVRAFFTRLLGLIFVTALLAAGGAWWWLNEPLALNLPQGARTTTIESKTNFVGAAAVDSLLTAECTAFHRGRTTMVWQTLIRNDAGKLCAIVSQTQLVIA